MMWRRMIHKSEAPDARAASTYSNSLIANTCPRMTRARPAQPIRLRMTVTIKKRWTEVSVGGSVAANASNR